jgi:uncharacterized protein (DUF2141 family)
MGFYGINFERSARYAPVFGLILALTIGTLRAQAPASSAAAKTSVVAKSTLTIHLTRFRNAQGKVNIDLFRDGEGFPLDQASVVDSQKLEIDAKTLSVTAVFADLPQGAYAVAVYHDDNLSGKMEFTGQGIPLKGYGFSNNPDTSAGPPSPQSATFAVSQPETKIEIGIEYWQQ